MSKHTQGSNFEPLDLASLDATSRPFWHESAVPPVTMTANELREVGTPSLKVAFLAVAAFLNLR